VPIKCGVGGTSEGERLAEWHDARMGAHDKARRTTGVLWWSGVTCAWSLTFAAPHFYWALGGRSGLGVEALAADEALGQSWFFAYNLLSGVLAIAGAALAVMLLRVAARRERTARVLRAAAWAACVTLSLRGVVGITDLAFQFARGVMDSPPILVAIEPWFVVGGMLFGVLAARTRNYANRPYGEVP